MRHCKRAPPHRKLIDKNRNLILFLDNFCLKNKKIYVAC